VTLGGYLGAGGELTLAEPPDGRELPWASDNTNVLTGTVVARGLAEIRLRHWSGDRFAETIVLLDGGPDVPLPRSILPGVTVSLRAHLCGYWMFGVDDFTILDDDLPTLLERAGIRVPEAA
jgi:hypothetical protein